MESVFFSRLEGRKHKRLAIRLPRACPELFDMFHE
jgi:hypothetical protein